MKNIIALIIAFFTLMNMSLCQEIISSGGDFHQTDQNSLSFTIGEPVSETFEAGEIILTQGFQQSKLIITAIYPAGASEYSFSVFPNPAYSVLNVELSTTSPQPLKYILYDLNGKVIHETISDQKSNKINVMNLNPGTYFLKIAYKKEHIKTYKIVKE